MRTMQRLRALHHSIRWNRMNHVQGAFSRSAAMLHRSFFSVLFVFKSFVSRQKNHVQSVTMARRFAQGSVNRRGAKRIAMRKHLNGMGRAFAGPLKKKLNVLVTRNRIIQRSLHSMSARNDRRFKCARHVCNGPSFTLDLSHNTLEYETQNLSLEEHVPQQEWDELLDSAFEAIGDTSVDIFDEQ
jgi:hypothetical protein